MTNCLFCTIAAKEIPSAELFSTDKVMAFLDRAPVTKGHTLIIPKIHAETLLDLSEDYLTPLLKAAQKIGKAQMSVLHADGFNLRMNNFAPAGQAVFHVHIHIIPRFEGDGLTLWVGKSYAEGEMDEVKNKLTEHFR